MESSHTTLIEHSSNSFLTQLELHFRVTSVSLLLRINPFTGALERRLNEPSLEYWCEGVLRELYTAMDARMYLYELLGRVYVHCILFHVTTCFNMSSTHYRFVFGEYEQQPCLFLPCITFKNYENARLVERYSILIRLTNNIPLHHSESYSSFTQMNGSRALKLSRTSYHTINNKMNDLTEYPDNVEIGFDIDENSKQEDEEEEDEEWMIDMVGVREVNGVLTLIESVKRSVMWDESECTPFKEQVKYCIEKLMPRLRFESTLHELKKLGEKGLLQQVEGDSSTRLIHVGLTLRHHT